MSEKIIINEIQEVKNAGSVVNNEDREIGSSNGLPQKAKYTGCDLSREEIISRRKQKKLLKGQRIQELKVVRRQREREKKKEKRKAEAALGIPGPNGLRKKLKKNKIDDSPNPLRVAVDLSYDGLMSDKDIAKCAKQLQRVYTANRKSAMPIKLYYTGLEEDSRVEVELRKYDGYKNWDVKFQPETYTQLFEPESIVYLSSDSETVLQELDPKAVYIIGGLVDHNAHKGLSHSRAQTQSLKTARLPLAEYIDMKTTSVLTIVHVFEIILKISEGQPWKETLLEVLPQRKFIPRNRKNKNREKSASSQECSEDENSNDKSDEKESPANREALEKDAA